ncbi:MAG: LysM domain-containing protein [Caldilineaceae bacterium]
MSGYITDALGWLAGTFYVIVALSIVYLYFFKIAPMVIAKIDKWDLFVVIRITIVLASLAFLIGCVAVITGDWIFSQVLDTLPRTRMAREIDRVTGSLVSIAPPGATPLLSSYSLGSSGATESDSSVGVGNAPLPATTPDPLAMPLVDNALQCLMNDLRKRYVPGDFSQNSEVMSRRDIPAGVLCEVAAEASTWGGWERKRNEKWQLLCSLDGSWDPETLEVNGTAARGLTGGSYYDMDNRYTVYGEGYWPQQCYDMSKAQPTPQPTAAANPENQVAPGTVAAGTETHTVQQGESLALIAQRYQVKVSDLVDANTQKYPQLTRNPNVIVVGWVLTIPAK